jgi:hypothetical protein
MSPSPLSLPTTVAQRDGLVRAQEPQQPHDDHQVFGPSLRVCLIRCYSGEAANHERDHRHLDDGFTGVRQQFVIFTQASVAIEPPEGALDNPALGNDYEPLDGIGTLGNLQANWPWRPQRLDPIHQRSGIGPVRPDVSQPRIPMPEDLQELFRTIAVLHPGGRHDHREDQPAGIDEEVTLAAFDLVARVVAPEPPFSVVLTD